MYIYTYFIYLKRCQWIFIYLFNVFSRICVRSFYVFRCRNERLPCFSVLPKTTSMATRTSRRLKQHICSQNNKTATHTKFHFEISKKCIKNIPTCMRIYIYMYLYVYIYIFIYLCIFLYIYIYAYEHLYIHIYASTCRINI